MKKAFFFFFAVGLSFLGASYRWGDSAHSIGLIKADGGGARHASFLESGHSRYSLIATASVLPPYSGDVRVALEGEPKMDYRIYLSAPVLNLGIKQMPELKDNVILGLKPRDRIALWVIMYPPVVDPVCGMAYGVGFIEYKTGGREYVFCAESCMEAFKKDPERYKDGGLKGKYTLALYDTKTDKPVMKAPLIIGGKEEHGDEGGHQH